MDRTFRFLKKKDLIGSHAIVIAIDETLVQSIARANFGRELSDVELNRFSKGYTSWWAYNDAYKKLNEFIITGIKAVTNKKNEDWNDIDNSLLTTMTLEKKAECLEEHSKLRS